MPAQWFVFTDDEAGPFSVEALAQMIALGSVQKTDLVRRGDAVSWQRADQVAALSHLFHRAQGRSRADRARQFQQGSLSRWWSNLPEFFSPKVWGLLAILGVLALAGQLWWNWSSAPEPFPAGPETIAMNVPSRVDQLRAREAVPPTIPGLRRGEPRPVPGLERVAWAKCPTLSHDLRTIVYVTYSGEDGLDDLFLSQRATAEVPFDPPRKLGPVNSAAREGQPALSPNGRELIFVRLGTPHQLWYSRYDDAARDFGPPKLLELTGEHLQGMHLDNPQFLSDTAIKLASGDEGFTQRQQLLATRPYVNGPFQVLRTIPVANPWPRYAFSPLAERGYFPSETGIQLTALQPQRMQFVTPDLLLTGEQLGPHVSRFDDAIWVAPREDVIVFCGPGSRTSKLEDHYLWMVKP